MALLNMALLKTALLKTALLKTALLNTALLSTVLLSISLLNTPLLNTAQAAPSYVGAQACQNCHQEAYALWQEADHYRSMAPANQSSVLGDFADARVEFHGISSELYERDGKYFVKTLGSAGKAEFEVSYTFGHYPLQQYLVTTQKGHLQALNIAWDSRPATEGGQRWFHLQETAAVSPESPFFWTRHLQNWNSRCAECHSTHLVKGYAPEVHRYMTTFSEPNVACEACHGPGSEHIEAASRGLAGSITTGRRQMSWHFIPGLAIAEGRGEVSASQVNMCGGCHSRRTLLGTTGTDYFDRFRLALLYEGLYQLDGQIDAEVFVLGSYLQSKMYAAGVSCTDCHEPHSGKLRRPGNSLCAQCHRPEVFDTREHHLHQAGAEGAQCVACHMPNKTYMLVDDRRDHRFGIPDPALTLTSAVPNACNDCHADKSPDWALKALGRAASSDDLYARLNKQLQAHDPLSLPAARRYVREATNPAIKRATLLRYITGLAPRSSLPLARAMLETSEPLLRAAAIGGLSPASPQVLLTFIKKLAADPVKLVRIEAGRWVSEMPPEVFLEIEAAIEAEAEVVAKNGMHELLHEYRASVQLLADTSAGQTELGLLELHQGRAELALAAYQQALKIEPNYVPALLNLADLHRASGAEDQAALLLHQAVQFAPEAGATNYSYALALVRQQQTQTALDYFEAAYRADDSQPGYAYAYAIALDAESRTHAAVQVLREAGRSWAPQYELLKLEILYLQKTKRFDEVSLPLSALVKIAPTAPEVRRWVQQYPLKD